MSKKRRNSLAGPVNNASARLVQAKGKNGQGMEITHSEARIFFGPLPDPETLAQYNNMISNGAERILAMAEKEQEHRHQIENGLLKNMVTISARGQIFAAIALLVCVGASIYFVNVGQPIVAGGFGLVSATGIITAFLNSTRRNRGPSNEADSE